MPQPAPAAVAFPHPMPLTKDWVPPTAPEPKEARRIAVMNVVEAVAAAQVNLTRAARSDDRDDLERALVELTRAFKSLAVVHETVRILVEDVG